MRQTCWRRESELRSWNPDHEHDPPGYGVSSVGLREAVAPYLLRGLLLRLAALVQPLCIWNIDLALPIHRVVVGGSCKPEGQSRFTASTGICRKPPGGLENSCSPKLPRGCTLLSRLDPINPSPEHAHFLANRVTEPMGSAGIERNTRLSSL